MSSDYSRIPVRTREALQRWVDQGLMPGSFLRSVLANDLYDACRRADPENAAALHDIVGWLINEAPYGCCGSQARVEEWSNRKRGERVADAGPGGTAEVSA